MLDENFAGETLVEEEGGVSLTKKVSPQGITVVHVFRSPFGGLFRHVCDLVRGQASRGLRVGVLCDAISGDAQSALILDELRKHCVLGVYRLPMSRSVALSDFSVSFKLYQLFGSFKPDIIHGHGAKGGAIARTMAPLLRAKSIYIPHGGALHFDNTTFFGRVYIGLERILKHFTDGVIFESKFAQDTYEKKIGALKFPVRVIYNGLKKEEFKSITLINDPVDFLYMGELRFLKGIKVLLHAAAELKKLKKFELVLVGSGPDRDEVLALVQALGLGGEVKLESPVYPARAAFSRGRCLVLPSLAESLPYMVLEVVAAKRPLITTRVGGIPEIYGFLEERLLEPNDSSALTKRMFEFLESDKNSKLEAEQIQMIVQHKFSYETMVKEVTDFYEEVLVRR